jgi:hypothetical protein
MPCPLYARAQPYRSPYAPDRKLSGQQRGGISSAATRGHLHYTAITRLGAHALMTGVIK